MTDRRGFVRLAMLLGTSAGVYSGSLAVVVALQAQADATAIARRQPTARGIDAVAAENDRLAAMLRRAAGSYDRAADRYELLASELVALDSSVGALGTAVEEVSGSAASLPSGIAVPRLTRSATVRVTTTVVHATTGASG
jgi:hypothetical protein